MSIFRNFFDKATVATAFYYNGFTSFFNFLLKKRWFEIIMTNRWFFLFLILISVEGFQLLMDFNSLLRINFYFIGMAVWIFFSYLAGMYRVTRTSTFASVIFLAFNILYLGYKVYAEVDSSFAAKERVELSNKRYLEQYEYEKKLMIHDIDSILKFHSYESEELSATIYQVFEKEYPELYPPEEDESSEFIQWVSPILIILSLFVLAIIGHAKLIRKRVE